MAFARIVASLVQILKYVIGYISLQKYEVDTASVASNLWNIKILISLYSSMVV